MKEGRHRLLCSHWPLLPPWIEARKKEQPAAKFVCHHLAFDKPFIAEAARQCGTNDLPHRNDWRCSQVLFGELMDRGLIEAGSSSLNRLKDLCGYAGRRNAEHDALEDAIITREGHAWLLYKSREAESSVKTCNTMGARIATLENLIVRAGNWLAGHESGATGVKSDIMDEAGIEAVGNAIGEVIQLAFPDKTPGDGENPQTAA